MVREKYIRVFFCECIFHHFSFFLFLAYMFSTPFLLWGCFLACLVFREIPLGECSNGNGSRKFKSLSPLYSPATINQASYVDYLNDHEKSMVIAYGPAGSGKTLFACIHAIHALKNGDIRKIVITRPLVSVEEEEIGFLPGNLVSKMDPWTRPMMDIFSEFYSMSDLTNFIKNGVLEIAPLAFMRGRTFHRTFVLADEMQNSSPSQMFMLTTRMGQESKLVVTGDLNQSDRSLDNGLSEFLRKYEYHREDKGDDIASRDIGIVHMGVSDVKRSSFVSHVLDIYNR